MPGAARVGYVDTRISSKKTYAFVRYMSLEMAIEAKQRMDGKRIGLNEIKIGYGNALIIERSSFMNLPYCTPHQAAYVGICTYLFKA